MSTPPARSCPPLGGSIIVNCARQRRLAAARFTDHRQRLAVRCTWKLTPSSARTVAGGWNQPRANAVVALQVPAHTRQMAFSSSGV
jgi:hypothetical protein